MYILTNSALPLGAIICVCTPASVYVCALIAFHCFIPRQEKMTAAQEELKRVATEKETVIAEQAKAIKEHTATIDRQQTQIQVR